MTRNETWRFEGQASLGGEPGEFLLVAGPGLAIHRSVGGVLGGRVHHDGTHSWAADTAGASWDLTEHDLFERAVPWWVTSGAWGELANGIRPPDITLERDGRSARLTLEANLPAVLRLRTVVGEEVWQFGRYRDVNGQPVAHLVTRQRDGIEDLRVEIQAAYPAGLDALSAPKPEPADYEFDAAVRPDLPVRRGPHGHLLVRAALNGEAQQWWVLDSGASNSTITATTADALGLEARAESTVLSVLGASSARAFVADQLSIGPLTIRGTPLAEFDLEPFGDAFGGPVAGILGFDVFRRSLVEVETAESRVALYPPHEVARFGDGHEAWAPLLLHSQHPTVKGRVEDLPALLRLDLGMGGASGIIVHLDFTRRARLLDGRDAEPIELGTARGRLGQVDSVTLGPSVFTDVPVVFIEAGDGPCTDPGVGATVGLRLLDPFRLVFDYGRQRIAFRSSRH